MLVFWIGKYSANLLLVDGAKNRRVGQKSKKMKLQAGEAELFEKWSYSFFALGVPVSGGI